MAEFPGSPVKIELGASAKLEVRTEVPSASTGRLLDAIVDAIRPFTEGRGLRADQIRLQREDVLLKIALRAAERRAAEGVFVREIEGKVLIPLLEKASLESSDDAFMIDRWACLLNSAGSQGINPRYVQMLSELTGDQARVFEHLCKNGSNLHGDSEKRPKHLDDAWISFSPVNIKRSINSSIEEADFVVPDDLDSFYEWLIELTNHPGCILIDAVVSWGENEISSIPVDENPIAHPANDIHLEILKSLGLASYEEIEIEVPIASILNVSYYRVTGLGAAFFAACTPAQS